MAIGDEFSVFRLVQSGFLVSYVFLSALLSIVGRRFVSRTNVRFLLDAFVWCVSHDARGAFCERSFPRLVLDLHDGVFVGTTQRTRAHEFFGLVSVYCSVFTMGALVLFGVARKQCDD